MNKLAQSVGHSVGTIDPGNVFLQPTADPANRFTVFVTAVIGLLTIVAAVWFIFLLVTGGIGMMTSGGDKNSMENSRRNITSGLIGLAVVVVGLFLVEFVVHQLLGLDILNPATIFNSIRPH